MPRHTLNMHMSWDFVFSVLFFLIDLSKCQILIYIYLKSSVLSLECWFISSSFWETRVILKTNRNVFFIICYNLVYRKSNPLCQTKKLSSICKFNVNINKYHFKHNPLANNRENRNVSFSLLHAQYPNETKKETVVILNSCQWQGCDQ